MGELNGHGSGDSPDDPNEGDAIDWTIPDKWFGLDRSDPAPAEQTIDEFMATHRRFPRDEPDEIDQEQEHEQRQDQDQDQDQEGVVDDATLSMDALSKSLDDYLTGPEAESIRMEVQGKDERSLVIKDYRDQVTGDASRLLSDTDEFDPHAMAEVTLGLIELQGTLIEPIIIPESIDDAELSTEPDVVVEDSDHTRISRDIAEKCKSIEVLRGEADITNDELARAYFVEWAKLGSQEADAKLKSLLAQERQDAKSPAEYKCLKAVCQASERMGLSPDYWIAQYADKDSAWCLQLGHCNRMRQQLVDVQGVDMDATHKEEQLRAVDTKINDLITQFGLPPEDPDALSAWAVSEYGLRALKASSAPEAVALITTRYLEVNGEREVTPDNLSKLVAFGTKALLKIDSDMAEDMDYEVTEMARALEKALQDPLMRDILACDEKSIARQQGIWRVAYDASRGRPVSDVLADIGQQELNDRSVRGDYLRSVAATQYAKVCDYTSVHTVIAELGVSRRAMAYVHFWGKAETPERMAALNPAEDGVVYKSDKALPIRYEIAQALVSGDTTTMITKALEAVATLQSLPETIDMPTIPPSLQWRQVEQLMDRVEQTGGGMALRRLCRAMLTQLQSGPPIPNINYRKIYEPLEKSGVRADHEAVRASILAGPDQDSAKAVQLIESALRAGMILINK